MKTDIYDSIHSSLSLLSFAYRRASYLFRKEDMEGVPTPNNGVPVAAGFRVLFDGQFGERVRVSRLNPDGRWGKCSPQEIEFVEARMADLAEAIDI